MSQPVFPRFDSTALLIVDVQERLMAAMPPSRVPILSKSHAALLEMAALFELPVIYTEQYPKGLGPTVEPLLARLSGARRVEKTEFSACQNPLFRDEVLGAVPADVVLTGLEAHVCVLQTAVDLMEAGRRVFVPHDAVASRTEANRENGLALLERAGAVITNTETLVFRRLGRAGSDAFKRLSALIR